MKQMVHIAIGIQLAVVASLSLQAQSIPKDSLYLGQTPPGTTPKVFKLAVAANSFAAERIAITRDGTSIYYQELDGYTALDGKPHTDRIKYYRFSGGQWNGPRTLFEGFIAPAFSVAEDTLFIQKVAGQTYYSVKNDTGWGNPINWSSTLKYSHYLQVTTNGHYYASSMPANGIGGLDRSRIHLNGTDTTATSLGLPVNTAGTDYDFFVARDESYMIVAGNSGLTVSFPRKDGSWTNPKNLGKAINFGLGAWGPYVTKDNKYLFYATGTKPDYSDTYVYWVSIGGMIDSLRKTNYEPYLKTRISHQSLALKQAFSYIMPDSTFIDDDGTNTLTYAATLSDGSPLPSWLTFTAATRTFSGTPSEATVLTVRVTATDAARPSASSTFEIRAGQASALPGMGASAQDPFPRYMAQVPPDLTPQLFALPAHEGFFPSERIAVSPDGKELHYSDVTISWSDYNIRHYKYADGKWNGPIDLFAGFLGPALSVDNTTMYFQKYGDLKPCWQSHRTGTGWSTPALCTDLPNPQDKHYPQVTTSGRIYAASADAANGVGQMDIATYLRSDGNGAFRSLGRPLNSPGREGDFYVARDESFIVFDSPHRGGAGESDLFISFRESNGSWSDPKNLGAPINTPAFDFGPYVTDDKRYLFFSRSDLSTRVGIYWVRFDSLLETLRKP